jgi:phosphatidylglycerol:prolipoprotein diacylglycerol transferase
MLLLAIMLWFTRKPRPTWAAAGIFSLGYGLLRFSAEFFREPDAHIGFQAFGWMTRGQLLCLPMILLGLYLLWRAYGRDARPAPGR